MNATIQTPSVPAGRAGTAAVRAATSPRTRLLGAAFLVAPLLLLSSSIAWAAGSESVRGILGFYACALFTLVIVTLTQAFSATLPRAAAALTLLGVLGVAAGVGFNVDNMHGALLDDAFLVDDGGTAAVFVAQLPGLMFPIAFVGIGVALLRCGVQPRWSAIVLIVAGVLFPMSRIGEVAALGLADDLLFVIALVPLGLAILQGRDVLAARHDGP